MSKHFYKRNLPHYQPPGGEFFITFRLANSLPKSAIISLRKKRKILQEENHDILEYKVTKNYFQKFDGLLDSSQTGPSWLKDREIAKIVADKIHELDSLKYALICYCLMPNHVHLLFKHLLTRDKSRDTSKFPITDIMRLIKGATARRANKILGRTGQFWHRESYDHLVRNNSERERIIKYILQNPVKAGLIKYWDKWEWTFCKEKYFPIR